MTTTHGRCARQIVAYLAGAPAKFPSFMRAHTPAAPKKARNAAAHGAIGTIVFDTSGRETHVVGARGPAEHVTRMRWIARMGR